MAEIVGKMSKIFGIIERSLQMLKCFSFVPSRLHYDFFRLFRRQKNVEFDGHCRKISEIVGKLSGYNVENAMIKYGGPLIMSTV